MGEGRKGEIGRGKKGRGNENGEGRKKGEERMR